MSLGKSIEIWTLFTIFYQDISCGFFHHDKRNHLLMVIRSFFWLEKACRFWWLFKKQVLPTCSHCKRFPSLLTHRLRPDGSIILPEWIYIIVLLLGIPTQPCLFLVQTFVHPLRYWILETRFALEKRYVRTYGSSHSLTYFRSQFSLELLLPLPDSSFIS